MLVTSWTKLWRQKLFQNTLNLKAPRVAIFADIIKVVTIFIKTIFKDSKKIIKELETILKVQSISVFLMQQDLQIFGEKCWCQQISRGVLRNSHDFWIFFRYNCTNFHHCRIYMTSFRKREPFYPTPVNNPKKAHPEKS